MHKQSTHTRRAFLQAAGVTLGGALAASKLGSTVVEAQAVKVRPDIATVKANDPLLAALKNGVKALQNLDTQDPTSPKGWTRLASIHNNFCTHSNWFFLPWHRAYLYYFEQVCREASGDPSFVLPYWDWTKSSRLPWQFWEDGSPLMDNTRRIGPNDAADPANVGQDVIYGGNGQKGIVNISDFITFASAATATPSGSLSPDQRRQIQQQRAGTGQLEGTPHNYIHGTFVQGHMATFMSPLDPIFWLHHSNIDRLWAEWLTRNPGQLPKDTTQQWQFWYDFQFLGFDNIRKPGQPVLTPRSVLSTYDLGYRYDTQPAAPVPFALTKVFENTSPKLTSLQAVGLTATVSHSVFTSSEISSDLRDHINAVRTAPTPNPATANATKLRLTVEVKPPEDLSTVVRLFLNSPKADQKTSIGDPSFVSTFSFFGADHADHGSGTDKFTFDVTSTVRNLSSNGMFKDDKNVQVTLVPVARNKESEGKASVYLASFKLEAVT